MLTRIKGGALLFNAGCND